MLVLCLAGLVSHVFSRVINSPLVRPYQNPANFSTVAEVRHRFGPTVAIMRQPVIRLFPERAAEKPCHRLDHVDQRRACAGLDEGLHWHPRQQAVALQFRDLIAVGQDLDRVIGCPVA